MLGAEVENRWGLFICTSVFSSFGNSLPSMLLVHGLRAVCVCVCDGCSVSVVQEVSVLHQPSCDGWHHHALSEDHECTHLSQRCQKGEAEFMKGKKKLIKVLLV